MKTVNADRYAVKPSRRMRDDDEEEEEEDSGAVAERKEKEVHDPSWMARMMRYRWSDNHGSFPRKTIAMKKTQEKMHCCNANMYDSRRCCRMTMTSTKKMHT